MLPIYFLYLAGEADKSEIAINKNRLLINSIGFVIGFTIVFVLLGATVTTLGHFLVSYKEEFRKASGVVMALFGLHYMGMIKLNFLNIEKKINYEFDKLGFLSSIVFGMVFGFGWSPCLGAFLGSALAMASNSKTVLQGITLLLVYSLGLGIPFLLSAVFIEKIKEAFKKIQIYNRYISISSGLLLILAGILVFTDNIKYISF
jgi:cytochrome c-type biogenesis protein